MSCLVLKTIPKAQILTLVVNEPIVVFLWIISSKTSKVECDCRQTALTTSPKQNGWISGLYNKQNGGNDKQNVAMYRKWGHPGFLISIPIPNGIGKKNPS